MESYKDCQINVVDNLRGDFAFSNSNKEIRVNSVLVKKGENNENIFAEAWLAREFYCKAVVDAKEAGTKINPSQVKASALEHAKIGLIAKIGEEEYKKLHNQTSSSKATVIKPSMSTGPDTLDIGTNVKKTAKEVEDGLEKLSVDDAALKTEFDNIDVDSLIEGDSIKVVGLPGKVNKDFSNAKDPLDLGVGSVEVDIEPDIIPSGDGEVEDLVGVTIELDDDIFNN